ncbi:MAG: rod shape-determining protein MreC [Gammaproteobacteria bacterium]
MPINPTEVAPSTAPPRLSTARLMLYLLLSVVLMAMDQSGQFVPRIRATLAHALEPVYYVAELPARALRGAWTYSRSHAALREENERQREAMLAQAGAVQRLDALETENRRLRSLLDASRGRDYEFRFAELVMVSLDPYAHRVMIDRGSEDGVFPGQAVIDGLGVMGQVEDVQGGQASVRLISDPDHAIPVQILRTGQRTVAYGTGDPTRLNLPNMALQSDIRPGDTLVTSGLGDRFPEGFPVAEVEQVERDPGESFARISARPLAALDRGREVLLVLPREAPAEAPPEPTAEGQGPEPVAPADDGEGAAAETAPAGEGTQP